VSRSRIIFVERAFLHPYQPPDERLLVFRSRFWIGNDTIALYFIGILLCSILYERWGVEKLLSGEMWKVRKEKDESLI